MCRIRSSPSGIRNIRRWKNHAKAKAATAATGTGQKSKAFIVSFIFKDKGDAKVLFFKGVRHMCKAFLSSSYSFLAIRPAALRRSAQPSDRTASPGIKTVSATVSTISRLKLSPSRLVFTLREGGIPRQRQPVSPWRQGFSDKAKITTRVMP